MVKRIAACVREYRRDSLLTPLYVALEVLLEVLIPLVMADLIDRPEKRAAMGQKARERFESQFTGQVFARNTEQIYYNILKGAK